MMGSNKQYNRDYNILKIAYCTKATYHYVVSDEKM